MDEWQEEEEVQVELSGLNIKELPQPEEGRDGAGQALDADGNPTAPQAGVWNRNKDKGKTLRVTGVCKITITHQRDCHIAYIRMFLLHEERVI